MKNIASISLAICFAFSLAVNAQDTRITPGMPNNGNGIKALNGNTSQDSDQREQGETTDECTSEESACGGEECDLMAKAMEALPKLVFCIGEMETCCHMTATRAAREEHEEIVYKVGRKRFPESRDAFESLVKQTEIYVKKFVKPRDCKESGTTTIAGESCHSVEVAAQLNEAVVSALKDLKIRYRVGEKDFEKFHDARRFAKKTHRQGVYLVGNEKFEDEFEARLALAHERFRSAIAAVQKVKSQAENDVAASSG